MIVVDFAAMPRRFAPPAVSPVADIARSYNCTALVACERAQERARFAEAKLSKAVADLRFVMAGGDPCRVCAVKCTFGEGNCKPVWRGEAGADL